MSEIFSEAELRELASIGAAGRTNLKRLITSHRQLQAERDLEKNRADRLQDWINNTAILLEGKSPLEVRQALDALKAELAEERKQHEEHCTEYELQMNAKIRQLVEAKWAHGDFDKAPCFICGYSGGGYYQPSTHPCAEEYHRRKDAQP